MSKEKIRHEQLSFGFNKGDFYDPTVFDIVKDNFTIMTEEPFGPLTPLLTFNNFDDVIKRANNQFKYFKNISNGLIIHSNTLKYIRPDE